MNGTKLLGMVLAGALLVLAAPVKAAPPLITSIKQIAEPVRNDIVNTSTAVVILNSSMTALQAGLAAEANTRALADLNLQNAVSSHAVRLGALDLTTATLTDNQIAGAARFTQLAIDTTTIRQDLDAVAASTGVVQLLAGTNVSLFPLDGKGVVTINSLGGMGDVTQAGNNLYTGLNTYQNAVRFENSSLDGSLRMAVENGTINQYRNDGSSTSVAQLGDGELWLNDTLGNRTIFLNGPVATVQVGENGLAGQLTLTDGTSATITQTGSTGDITVTGALKSYVLSSPVDDNQYIYLGAPQKVGFHPAGGLVAHFDVSGLYFDHGTGISNASYINSSSVTAGGFYASAYASLLGTGYGDLTLTDASVATTIHLDGSTGDAAARRVSAYDGVTDSSVTVQANQIEVGADGSRGSLFIKTYSNSATSVAGVRHARGSFAAPGALLVGNDLGFFNYGGYDGTGFMPGAALVARADESWSVGNNGTRFEINVTSNTTAVQYTALTVKNNGFVGVGTGSPTQMLDVAGGIQASFAALGYSRVVNDCGTAATCTATCASGQVLGGGCNAVPQVSPLQGYPDSATTYLCESTVGTSNMTAYALCANLQ